MSPPVAIDPGSRVHRVLLGVAVFVGLANVAFYFPRAVDDAFISLRYAEHVALGMGGVYNRGEWVEGYSSVTWMLLQAAGMACGLDGLTATKLWALAATLALFVGVYRAAREVFDMAPAAAAAALVVVAANSYVLSWCMFGLETPLYLCLIVWFSVWVRRVSEGAVGTGAVAALTAVGVAAALTRPEAPLLLTAIGAGAAGVPRSRSELRVRVGRLAVPALAVVFGYATWLVVRFAVYGLWVPHTYFAKQGHGFTWTNLNPLFTDGAGWVERTWWLLSVIAAVVVAAGTRRVLALFLLGTGLFFVARVEMDWMPNMRHFLPMWIFATLAVVACAERVTHAARAAEGPRRTLWRAVGAGVFSVLVALPMHLVQIDARFSPYDFQTHGRGTQWVRPKTLTAWRSTWALMRGEAPPRFAGANPDALGLIDQSFVALEASARPEEETWFFGRDIGMVGYLSPIQVFDTDGLFTPAAIRWTDGRDRQPIADQAALEAFERPIVAGEVYFEWTDALGRSPHLLDGFDIVIGSRRHPYRFTQSAGARPDAAELRRRYERAEAKLPGWFTFSELYGLPAGAAVALRARTVIERAELGAGAVVPRDAIPDLGRAHLLDQTVRWHGCSVDRATLRRGERALLSCWMSTVRPPRHAYRVFVHAFAGDARITTADHAIAHGYAALADLDRAQAIVTRTFVDVPPDAPLGALELRVGLWEGDHRAVVAPVEGTDGQDRIVAATLIVEESP